MSIAIDTHVLVRLLVRDEEAQFAFAQRVVDIAAAAQEPVLIADCVLIARVTHLGRARFLAFDIRAAKLPRAELLT